MAKITVSDACIGCGACTGISPDIFEINDEGLAHVVGEGDIDSAKEAAECCPVEAISVEE